MSWIRSGNDFDAEPNGPLMPAERLPDRRRFVLVRGADADEKPVGFDQFAKRRDALSGREVAAAFADDVIGRSALVDADKSQPGPVSVPVQVIMRGVDSAHEQIGKLVRDLTHQ